MASGRRTHRVDEDHQIATAKVRRVAKSFSAVSSALGTISASSRTSPERKSEAHTAGARRTTTGPQHWQRLRISRHPCVADSQGVTEQGRERRENSSPQVQIIAKAVQALRFAEEEKESDMKGIAESEAFI